MERGVASGGDDPARAVGMCDRLLTFLAKNLSMMNRQKNITEGPRNGGTGSGRNDHKNRHAGEEDDDEFAVKIEKAEFELSHEEEGGHRSFTATILEGSSTDVTVRASDRQKEAKAEAAREAAAAAETATAAAAVAVQGEKKVRKSVTIKEEAAGGKVDKKPSQLKKRPASSSSGGQQVGTGGGPEEPKPAPPRWGLRPRMPSILRVPSNINEKSATFIQERKRGFVGAAGKPEK